MADEYIKVDDAINKAYELYEESDFIRAEELSAFVKSIPAADVAPVVLCKDCKYFRKEYGRCLNIDGMAKQLVATDFCSCGAKMEAQDG